MKNKTVRFGGAQIPCTPNIAQNKIEIKKAIDWAADNKVDYLVTPEGSLSGYTVNFEKNLPELVDALPKIEQYAHAKNVGLCLGTLWQENMRLNETESVPVKKNQIRYYGKNGKLIGTTNKTVMAFVDNDIGIVPHEMLTGISLPFEDEIIPTAGLICADLYGWGAAKGGLPQQYHEIGAKLYIHSTNGERNTDPVKNEIEELWVEAWLRRVSMYQSCPIIVADNCYMMDGTQYSGKTLTQSGVIINGEWVVKASRYGIQYFYYDLPLEGIAIKVDSRQTT